MPALFSRTLRSLSSDTARPRTWLMSGALLILAGWLAWFFLAEVPVHLVTDRGRLEVERASHPVVPPLEGRIQSSHLELGRDVRAGELLVQLDDRGARLSLEEAIANQKDRVNRLEALGAQILAEEESAAAERQATEAAVGESTARGKKRGSASTR